MFAEARTMGINAKERPKKTWKALGEIKFIAKA